MVLAREKVAEYRQRVGFRALQQFIGAPNLANQVCSAVAVTFGKQDPRERELTQRAHRTIGREAVNRFGVAALLPQAALRAPAHERHARPAGIVGNERRISAEGRVSVRMTQDEPFHELASRRVADRFLDGDRLAYLALARKINRILDGCEISREWRSGRALTRRLAGWRRAALRRGNMRC